MRRALLFILAATLVLLGFWLPLWPLTLCAVFLLLIFGEVVVACALALFLDLLWGVPTGSLHILRLPLTLCAIALSIARVFLVRRMRGSVPERLR